MFCDSMLACRDRTAIIRFPKKFVSFSAAIAHFLVSRPVLLRELAQAISAQKNIIMAGDTCYVLGYQEVTDVLSRNDDFQLSQKVRSRFPTGEFILTQESSAEYHSNKEQLRQLFFDQDNITTPIREYVEARAAHILRSAAGDFDILAGYSEQIAAEVVCRFLIGPATREDLPDNFIQDLQKLATLVITAETTTERLLQKYNEPASNILQLVEARMGNNANTNDIVARLLGSGLFTPELIKQTVAGMAVAGIGNIASAVAKAMDQLLLRPVQLASARAIANNRSIPEPDKRRLLKQIIFEALRFNPVFPMLSRHCVRDTALQASDGSVLRIPANASIIVGVLPAMFDSSEYADPRRFQAERNVDRHLLFGMGMKRCFGEEIAEAQIIEMVYALLKDNRVNRQGRFRYRGPYCASYRVRL